MYTVTITKKNFVSGYMDIENCPLANAIKEQTDLPLKNVGGCGEVTLLDDTELTFYPNSGHSSPKVYRRDEEPYWGSEMYGKMKLDEVESFTVNIQ
jgi:hypothetical protein